MLGKPRPEHLSCLFTHKSGRVARLRELRHGRGSSASAEGSETPAYAAQCRSVSVLAPQTRASSLALVSPADAETPAQPEKHERGEGVGKSEQCFVYPVFFTVPVSHSESVSGGAAVAHRNAAFDVENNSRFAAASIVKDDQLGTSTKHLVAV